jgi:hypothetical protein
MRLFDYYALRLELLFALLCRSHRMTDANSLLFSAALFNRLAAPLAFNYLNCKLLFFLYIVHMYVFELLHTF